VFSACKILEKSIGALPPIFLQVDEYQDLNPADQRFVSLVASNKQSQVVVVGDDAQSIYKFRHANYRGLRDLWDSPEWEHVCFPDCHRLPPHIQRPALALIASEQYLGSAMNPRPDNGRRLSVYQCTKPKYQAKVVARRILEFKKQRTREDGAPIAFSDIIVLCPSRKFVPGLRHALDKATIPSKDVLRAEIPDHIWKIILLVRMAFHRDNIAFRQWLDMADLDSALVAEIRRKAMQSDKGLIEFCESAHYEEPSRIIAAADRIREASRSMPQLLSTLLQFPHLHLNEAQILEALSYLLLEEDQSLAPASKWLGILYRKFGILEDESDTATEDAVLVTTFHSAKGLEGELVCLTWMNERYMPFPDRDIEEERRLLYVGMTRAKQDLIITFHELFDETRGYLRTEALTPFLREIAGHLSITRISARDLS